MFKGRSMKLAVVGDGPRALAALEALAAIAATSGTGFSVTWFAGSRCPGAGPNFDPGQLAHNLLNIPLRDIDLAAPQWAQGGVPGFAQWLEERGDAADPDDFPPRRLVGHYLQARLGTLARAGIEGFLLEVIAARAFDAGRDARGWHVRAGETAHGPFDHLLLLPGHLESEPDAQLSRWTNHAARQGLMLARAYPSEALLERSDWRGRKVAIRGFGLSMIDVARALTLGLGGQFVPAGQGRLGYVRSGAEPARLLPFSLDGLPQAPKPATAALDTPFIPTRIERDAFRSALASTLEADDAALGALCATLAHLVTARLLEGDTEDARRWLVREIEDHAQPRDRVDPAALLAHYLDMAHGLRAPSIGYVAGQLWRHCQGYLRQVYNDADHRPARAAAALMRLDEALKRYSYGPPAMAGAQLLALIEAGIVSLRQVDDPDIEMVPAGWCLSRQASDDVCDTMIDSVLAGPDLEQVDDPLVASLRDGGLLSRSDAGPGARTDRNCRAIERRGNTVEGLWLAGRMSAGSTIAADSLHDCFGGWIDRWLAGLLR